MYIYIYIYEHKYVTYSIIRFSGVCEWVLPTDQTILDQPEFQLSASGLGLTDTNDY